MDDRQLERILKNIEIPIPDGNAKKRATNLALVEFDKHQKEKAEKRQGFSLFGRLTDSSDKNTRRTVMQRRLVYGGMATAMVVVLAATMSVTQQTATFTKGAELKPAPAYTGGGNDFSSIATNIQTSQSWFSGWGGKAKEQRMAQNESVSQTYAKAVEESNKQNVEKAINSGASSLPVPVSTPTGKLSVGENQPADDGRVMEREEIASADSAAAPKPSMPMQEPAKKSELRARVDLQAQVAGGRAYTEADRLARQKMPET
ncbi:MAG TPA: hypothetical protein VL625_06020, partial [Patescibacteria group bacterium]|nr:hypothetical protein [Patescibacteria group bacterium]